MAQPAVDIERDRFNCRIDGPADARVLVLSNSLGTNLAMWDAQIPALTARLRVLRYDSRGHGASAVTPGPYSIEQLARDVLILLDGLKIERVHFCGLSMGGMVGMWLGVHAPERLDRLVLCNTSPKIGPPELWKARIEAVRKGGVSSIADAVLGRWFTAGFRESSPEQVARMRAMLTATSADGYVAACAAIRDMDQWDSITGIRRPTLVISGTHDAATPAADGRRMAEVIPGARYVELNAAHISNIEAAPVFTTAVLDFLTH
jgi:3-oxoadipate enol-lactonase